MNGVQLIQHRTLCGPSRCEETRSMANCLKVASGSDFSRILTGVEECLCQRLRGISAFRGNLVDAVFLASTFLGSLPVLFCELVCLFAKLITGLLCLFIFAKLRLADVLTRLRARLEFFFEAAT